jgi:hypothetical protein
LFDVSGGDLCRFRGGPFVIMAESDARRGASAASSSTEVRRSQPMLIILLLVVAVLVVGVLAFAATRPDTFHVQRSTTVQAPPEAIQPRVADFRRWTEWSPYEGLDPNLERTYGGAPNGPGATYAWSGNGKAGEGRMEILAATPARVTVDLRFTRPFKAHNTSEFAFEPRGAATVVTWSMHGPMPVINRVICLFISMDALVGKDFERGLASLKAAAEDVNPVTPPQGSE